MFCHNRRKFARKLTRYSELVEAAVDVGSIKEYNNIVSFLNQNNLLIEGPGANQDAIYPKAVLSVKATLQSSSYQVYTELSILGEGRRRFPHYRIIIIRRSIGNRHCIYYCSSGM